MRRSIAFVAVLIAGGLMWSCVWPPGSERRTLEDYPCDRDPTPPAQVVQDATGGPTYENEVHDCQRLVVAAGPRPAFGRAFGPLTAIYPIDRAMDLDTGPEQVMAFANIYNWGDLTSGDTLSYAPLTIEPGWNCLWMQAEGNRWLAQITRRNRDVANCQSQRPPPDLSSDLTVVRHVHADPRASYPKTARWRWSESDTVHYLGIKCGSAWCSVGPPGFQPREVSTLEGPPHLAIPGYFDEQHLAVFDSATQMLRPGPWGRIEPSEELFNKAAEDARTRGEGKNWLESGNRTVGRIEIASPLGEARRDELGLAQYTRKFDLQRQGSWLRRDILLQLVSPSAAQASYGPFTPASTSLEIQVLNMANHGAAGSVRWRWRDDDETPWISCFVGCCSIGGFD